MIRPSAYPPCVQSAGGNSPEAIAPRVFYSNDNRRDLCAEMSDLLRKTEIILRQSRELLNRAECALMGEK